MIDKKIPNLSNIKDMLGDVAESVTGGADVSLDDIEPTPVTDETEKAFKEAQRKKAEDEDSSGYYG